MPVLEIAEARPDEGALHLRNTYNHLYRKGYADSGSCYVLAELLLRRVDVRGPVLDVGCGHCPFLKTVQQARSLAASDLFGVDISDVVLRENVGSYPLVQASAVRLPFGDRQFRVCYSADMIEHLPQAHALGALREMARVTRGHLALGVCCREAYTLDEYGQQVHLTVQPPEWWQSQLSELGQIKVAEIPDDIHGFYILEV